MQGSLGEIGVWLGRQREVVDAVLSGATLDAALTMLARGAEGILGPGTRAAFSLAAPEVTPPQQAAGGTGWRFPIQTRAGAYVGAFDVHPPELTEPTERDLQFGAFITSTASMVIALHESVEARQAAESTVRELHETLHTPVDEQQAFLLTFSDALRAEASADAVANSALRLICEHLRLDRCYIGRYQLADDRGDFTHQVGNDRIPPMPAHVRLSDFPEALRAAFDRTLVIDDVQEAEGLADADRQNLAALGLRALVAATLRRGEHNPLWSIVAVSASPRRWTRAEVALLEDLTERTWTAMERARVEEALRVSEGRLQKMLNIEGVGVLTFSGDGRLLDANDAFLQMHGYTREDVASGAMTWRDLTPEAHVAESERQMEKLARTGRVGPYEKEYRRKDGSRSWLLFAGAAIGDGTVVEYCIDVSAKKRNESRYRSLFESIDQGFCVLTVIFDEEGRGVDYQFDEVNPAFERHTGLVNAVGRTARELVPDLEPRWPEIYGRVARTGQPERFVDHSTPMGRWFEVDAFRIGPPEELTVALLFSDISDRVQAEQRQRDSDRRKDEFLAVLGHELRNPLAPIRTGLDLLDRARTSPALLDRVQPMMQRQVSHLTRLVDDLLDMARVSRGANELRRAPLDLHQPVQAAIEQVRALVADRRHTLSVRHADRPLPVHGDFERLTQVIANLLTNAAKYSAAAGEILISAEEDGDHAVVRVRDAGYGIPPERLTELFEMFTQVPEHRKMDGGSGGLGIGLALARQLVEMHGGSIEASSLGLGHGSEFVVRLPLHQHHAAAEAREEPSADAPRTPRRILVVDDNLDAAESLRLALTLHGHGVEVAHDGPAALQQFDAFTPDTVLLDLGLPGWDGLEVAQRIRQRPMGRTVQLVAVTGWGQDSDRRRTRDAGFDHHLTKPVVTQDLLTLLGEARKA